MHPGERLDYERYDLRFIVTLDFGGYRQYQFDFFNCYQDAIDFIRTATRRFKGDDDEKMIASIEARKEERRKQNEFCIKA